MFDCKVQNAVEQQVMPTFKSIFYSCLGFSSSRNSLNEIGNMNHRKKTMIIQEQVCGRDLTGFTELLLMPHQIVIEIEFLRKFSDDRFIRIDHDFPHLIEIAVAMHPFGQLEAVRTAFRQIIDLMREKILFLISFLKELFDSFG